MVGSHFLALKNLCFYYSHSVFFVQLGAQNFPDFGF